MDIGKKKVEALVELRAKTEKVKGDVYKCWARFPGATQRTGQGREALTHQWWPPQMQAPYVTYHGGHRDSLYTFSRIPGQGQ